MKYATCCNVSKSCFMWYKLMNGWMMLMFMKCKCKCGSQTPGVLQRPPSAGFVFVPRLGSATTQDPVEAAVFFPLLLLLRWCWSCSSGPICFLSSRICLLYLIGSSSSRCAAPLRWHRPRGEIDPQSPYYLIWMMLGFWYICTRSCLCGLSELLVPVD